MDIFTERERYRNRGTCVYLRLVVNKDLKPRQQSIARRNKVNNMLGFISRSVSNKTEVVILHLYIALQLDLT